MPSQLLKPISREYIIQWFQPVNSYVVIPLSDIETNNPPQTPPSPSKNRGSCTKCFDRFPGLFILLISLSASWFDKFSIQMPYHARLFILCEIISLKILLRLLICKRQERAVQWTKNLITELQKDSPSCLINLWLIQTIH